MHSTLAGFYPFLLGSPARCTFLLYLCLYICLGSPARSQLSLSRSCPNNFPLNAYLHRIGKVASKQCSSCWNICQEVVTKMIIHFLFECPLFNYQRHDLNRKLGTRSRNLRAILANKDHIKELLSYIGCTG